jgi:hypothetical protein
MKRVIFCVLIMILGFGNQVSSQGVETLENEVSYYLSSSIDCEGKLIEGKLFVYLDEETLMDCDSAVTTFELNICSGEILCLEKKRFDSLNSIINLYYDSLNEEYKNYKFKEGEINYLEVKSLHEKAIRNFITYSRLEVKKTSIEIGEGRLNNYYSNYRMYQLLQQLNNDLQSQVDDINNQ